MQNELLPAHTARFRYPAASLRGIDSTVISLPVMTGLPLITYGLISILSPLHLLRLN
jgi:hypothetical protein